MVVGLVALGGAAIGLVAVGAVAIGLFAGGAVAIGLTPMGAVTVGVVAGPRSSRGIAPSGNLRMEDGRPAAPDGPECRGSEVCRRLVRLVLAGR